MAITNEQIWNELKKQRNTGKSILDWVIDILVKVEEIETTLEEKL